MIRSTLQTTLRYQDLFAYYLSCVCEVDPQASILISDTYINENAFTHFIFSLLICVLFDLYNLGTQV